MKTNKCCQFPDCSEVQIKSILQETEETNQALIAYEDAEVGIQELWVPKEFIVN